MNFDLVEARLHAVIASIEIWLPRTQIAEMSELVDHREPGVALELVCTQLDEAGVSVPPEMVDELRAIAAVMEMTLPVWFNLAST